MLGRAPHVGNAVFITRVLETLDSGLTINTLYYEYVLELGIVLGVLRTYLACRSGFCYLKIASVLTE